MSHLPLPTRPAHIALRSALLVGVAMGVMMLAASTTSARPIILLGGCSTNVIAPPKGGQDNGGTFCQPGGSSTAPDLGGGGGGAGYQPGGTSIVGASGGRGGENGFDAGAAVVPFNGATNYSGLSGNSGNNFYTVGNNGGGGGGGAGGFGVVLSGSGAFAATSNIGGGAGGGGGYTYGYGRGGGGGDGGIGVFVGGTSTFSTSGGGHISYIRAGDGGNGGYANGRQASSAGGFDGGKGGNGGAGIFVANGSAVNVVYADVAGGQGGQGGRSSFGTPGVAGSSGAGIYQAVTGDVTVSAKSLIRGGRGAYGVQSSSGGAGIEFHQGGMLTNTGSYISGGDANYTRSGNVLTGVAGAAGVVFGAAGTVVNTDSSISGGRGGSVAYGYGTGFVGGKGGAGISMLFGGTITNSGTGSNSGGKIKMLNSDGGNITGGRGGYAGTNPYSSDGQATGGAGGSGIIGNGLLVTNNVGAVIAGGRGADYSQGGFQSILNGGAGGAGIDASNSRIVNLGTIKGGTGGFGQNTTVNADGGIAITGSNLYVVNSGTIAAGIPGGVFTPKLDVNPPENTLVQEGGDSIMALPAFMAEQPVLPQSSSPAVAIKFTGGVNTLELQAGSIITGQVVAFSPADTLALGGAADQTFDVSAIAPAGTTSAQYQNFGVFVKKDAATATLTNTTTAVTNWSVLGGTLSISSDSNLGAASGTVTLDGGTLLNSTPISTARSFSIGSNGGTLQSDGTNTLALSGTISGSGRLTKTGAATLTLSGANSYSGGTSVQAGTLAVGSSTAAGTGAITLAGGTTLQFAANNLVLANNVVLAGAPGATFALGANTSVVNGVISGTGPLTKSGTGTLTLGGSNSYSGGTIVQAGTLAVTSNTAAGTGTITLKSGSTLQIAANGLTLANNIALPGTADPVIDTGANNVTETGIISGTDTLTKTGSGTLTLTGQSTLSGATNVTQGTLVLTGTLGTSIINVSPGATLGGSGSAGGLLASNGSVVSPGIVTPFSTLSVAGSVTFQAGSFYNVRIGSAGQTDLIRATGAASLTGGTVNVIAGAGTFNPATTYTILTAAGGVTGRFAALTASSNLAFLTPSLTYTGNNVILGFTQTANFTTVGITPNQIAAASGIQSLGIGNPVFNAILSQSADQARRSFDAASGEIHASAVTTAFEDSRFVREAILDRLYNASGETVVITPATRPIISKDGPRVAAPVSIVAASPYAFWGQGFGDWGRNGGNGNAATLNRSLGGFILGADATVYGPWRVGVAGGYTHDSINVRARGSSGSLSSVFGAVYAGATFDAINLRGGASYAGTSTKTNRTISFINFNDAASASYSGNVFQAFGEVGYKIAFANGTIEPMVGAAFIHVNQNGFVENGGPARLSGNGRNSDMETTTVAVRGEIAPFADTPVTLRGLLGWRHAFGAVNPKAVLAFTSGSTPFTVSGAPIARDAAMVEALVDWRATSALSIGVSYSGQLSSRVQDHAFKGNILYKF